MVLTTAYNLTLRIACITICLFTVQSSGLAAGSYFGPVTGCTFYNELGSAFWGCAAPKIKKRSCTKTKCVGPVCYRYKGDRGFMHRPVFLIEVTTRFGESLFSDTYPNTLGKHMEAAKRWYKSRGGPSSSFTDGGSVDRAGGSIFWHARVLPVPFATAAFAYSDLPAMSKASAAAPSCFYGASEFVPDQWNLGLGDLPFAAAWTPIGLRQCMSTVGAAASAEINAAVGNAMSGAGSAMAGAGSSGGGETFGLGCAYGVPTNLLLAQNMSPSSDALDYRKLCMGQLGGLLPREGLISNSNPFRSAVMAAWKFASLTKDAFFDSVGGIEPTDKWQLVYPKSIQKSCVDPARILTDWVIPGPFEMREGSEVGETYVFAIWRESSTSCYEPETADLLWRQVVKGPNFAAIKGVCGL